MTKTKSLSRLNHRVKKHLNHLDSFKQTLLKLESKSIDTQAIINQLLTQSKTINNS